MRKHTWPNLIWQSISAAIFIAVVLFMMNQLVESDVLWAVGAGALSSSCFIVFGKPTSSASLPYKIVGGYIIGVLCGVIFHFVATYFHNFDIDAFSSVHFHVIGLLAALAVGISLFLMAILRFEHPPAAGMSLVLVIDMKDYKIIFLVIIAAIVLALIRRLLCNQLVDLS